MNSKNALLLLILILLVLNNHFTSNILTKFNGSIENGEITQSGHIIQSIIIVLGYICIEKLIDYDLL